MNTKLNTLFNKAFVLLFCTIGACLLFSSKAAFSLWCSSIHQPVTDFFFKYLTHLGSGYFVVLIGLICIYRNRILAYKILLGYAISGILVQILKKQIFKGFPRPVEYFKEMADQLHWVDGLQLNHWNSFPSGHTASAFLLATLLSFRFKDTAWQLLLFTYACLVGFSRVYLLEHFLVDAYAGAAIGFLTALGIELFFKSSESSLFDNDRNAVNENPGR